MPDGKLMWTIIEKLELALDEGQREDAKKLLQIARMLAECIQKGLLPHTIDSEMKVALLDQILRPEWDSVNVIGL
jgi:hypothetical protein